MAPGAGRITILHQAALPQRSFTADRAEVRAERVDARPAGPHPRVSRGHSPCSAGRASKTAGTSGTLAAGHSPRRSGSCRGLWTHTGLRVGRRGPGEGHHARRPSRGGSVSSCVCGRVQPQPHGLCPQAPLSVGFSRQEHWRGSPRPPPGDLPYSGIERSSPALAGRFFTTESPGKPFSVTRGENFELTVWNGHQLGHLSIWSILIHEGNSKMTKY